MNGLHAPLDTPFNLLDEFDSGTTCNPTGCNCRLASLRPATSPLSISPSAKAMVTIIPGVLKREVCRRRSRDWPCCNCDNRCFVIRGFTGLWNNGVMLLLFVAPSRHFATVERSNVLMPSLGQSSYLGAHQSCLDAIHCNFAGNSSRSQFSDERQRRRCWNVATLLRIAAYRG